MNGYMQAVEHRPGSGHSGAGRPALSTEDKDSQSGAQMICGISDESLPMLGHYH
jgi:hypothetical protein